MKSVIDQAQEPIPVAEVKEAWETWRHTAELHASPVLALTRWFRYEDDENIALAQRIITFERVAYGGTVVIESDGVIVETLCGKPS